MKSILFAGIVGISSTLFAIVGIQSYAQTPSHGMNSMTTMECPITVAGADLSIEDTIDGTRLTFTTKTGDVAELRRDVEAMARMHGASTTEGIHKNMMPFSAAYEAVPDGARLTLTPRDPQTLEEFRRKVREHALLMKKDECAMMGSMMRGMMDGAHPPADKKQ